MLHSSILKNYTHTHKLKIYNLKTNKMITINFFFYYFTLKLESNFNLNICELQQMEPV